VITSPEGAALKDIRRTVERRWPIAEMVLLPAAVQGDAAGPEIVAAFEKLEDLSGIDAVILARGGGSAEDLWIFNTEKVARSVARCTYPVVTGIGHEIDTTVCDFVSDLVAPTPTAAAEMIIPESTDVRRIIETSVERIAELCSAQSRRRLERVEFMMRSSAFPAIEHALDLSIHELEDRLNRIFQQRENLYRSRLDKLSSMSREIEASIVRNIRKSELCYISVGERLGILSPAGLLGTGRERLGKLIESARLLIEGKSSTLSSDINGKLRALKGLGPREVLGRGYAYCTSAEGDTIVGSIADVEEGSRITVNFVDGDAGCLVESRRKDGRWLRRSHSKTL
jgi:exodeoxyribonuclease VII large subunit